MEIRKLKGSKITDVEVNINGYVVLYVENGGRVYAIDFAPIVRDLGKVEKKAPEMEAQELSDQINNGKKTLNQARKELGLEPVEGGDKKLSTFNQAD